MCCRLYINRRGIILLLFQEMCIFIQTRSTLKNKLYYLPSKTYILVLALVSVIRHLKLNQGFSSQVAGKCAVVGLVRFGFG
jgi:hypothetical protein